MILMRLNMYEQGMGKAERDKSRLIVLVSVIAMIIVIGLIALLALLGDNPG